MKKRAKHTQLKRASLAPARGQSQGESEGLYGRKSQTKNQRQGKPLVGVHIPQWEKSIPKGGG